MIYTIENKHLKISVDTFGAQLMSFYSKDTDVEYLWQGDPKYWTGRAYNLFPVIGRMYQGFYRADGKEYRLDCHGLARYYPFELCARTANKLSFSLQPTEEMLEKYPYRFTFTVTFRIRDKKLTVEYQVKNEDDKTMYFAFGGHPGINIPFDGGNFEDYYLEFAEKTPVVRHILSPNKFMADVIQPYPLQGGVKMPFRHDLFDDDAVVFGNTCRVCYIKGKGTHRKIKMEYTHYKYLGVWHMDKTDAPYVCLEPWSALPSTDGKTDDLETKADMFSLAASKTRSSTYSLEIFE